MTIDIPSKDNIVNFRKILLKWYRSNKRRYPWRETDDPFKIIIAEIMLRRTKADQVERVYSQLFTNYPSVKDIANADDERLEKILYPLGLKWRSPTFKLLAREIINKCGGEIPRSRDQLLLLPGVGDYVAGALLSIAFNKREWLVDSNIVRVYRRYFGIPTSKEGRRDKHVIAMSKEYVSYKNPRDANLAILDFSAIICIPIKPKCTKCPLNNDCYYYHHEIFRNEVKG